MKLASRFYWTMLKLNISLTFSTDQFNRVRFFKIALAYENL